MTEYGDSIQRDGEIHLYFQIKFIVTAINNFLTDLHYNELEKLIDLLGPEVNLLNKIQFSERHRKLGGHVVGEKDAFQLIFEEPNVHMFLCAVLVKLFDAKILPNHHSHAGYSKRAKYLGSTTVVRYFQFKKRVGDTNISDEEAFEILKLQYKFDDLPIEDLELVLSEQAKSFREQQRVLLVEAEDCGHKSSLIAAKVDKAKSKKAQKQSTQVATNILATAFGSSNEGRKMFENTLRTFRSYMGNEAASFPSRIRLILNLINNNPEELVTSATQGMPLHKASL
ncbi:unnamed protein product [Orchesella dallaii]|uniref:Uncharacterized protein n=1 Tax=Orchesella dallaii TaxID=48710 RepID=A0ABP1R4I2_9HEXA